MKSTKSKPLCSGPPRIPELETIRSGTLVTFTVSGVTNGWAEERISSPVKLNVKTGPHFAYILVLVCFSFTVSCFFAFFGVFFRWCWV